MGRKVYKVDGKILRIRKTLVFEDAKGKKLCQIKERLLTIKDSMVIEDPDGRDLAVIKKALITPFRDKWDVNVKGVPTWMCRATSLTMNIRSSKATRLPRSPGNGSA